MKRKSFKMFLKPGCEEEFIKRYNAMWPDLKELFKESEILDFSIFFDRKNNGLYVFQLFSKEGCEDICSSDHIIMKKWWEFMSDVICVDDMNQPILSYLDEFFYLEFKHDL